MFEDPARPPTADASYGHFPTSGMPLEVTPDTKGGLSARLCEGLSAWLPGDTVLEPMTSPPRRPCRVGHIVPLDEGWGLVIPVPGGPVPVRQESQPRQGVVRLLQPDAVAAIDRVRIDSRGTLQHLILDPSVRARIVRRIVQGLKNLPALKPAPDGHP